MKATGKTLHPSMLPMNAVSLFLIMWCALASRRWTAILASCMIHADMYISITPGKERTRASTQSRVIFDAARDELLKYEDAFEVLASFRVAQKP